MSVTTSHEERVSINGAKIAYELEHPHPEHVRVACLLHDVGKIAVPDWIINKPGRLTADEYAVVKTHSIIGAQIVTALGFPFAGWIRHHHERVDGTGYPDQLDHDRIPIESRIMLVADAYDALTQDRPYRHGRSSEDALDELQANAGTQFDTECFDALTLILT